LDQVHVNGAMIL